MKLSIAIALTAALITLSGCSAKPSKAEAIGIAKQYLSTMPMAGGGDDIKILKMYDKDGAVMVTLQSGSMICDMPMVKTDSGWIARGIHCGG